MASKEKSKAVISAAFVALAIGSGQLAQAGGPSSCSTAEFNAQKGVCLRSYGQNEVRCWTRVPAIP